MHESRNSLSGELARTDGAPRDGQNSEVLPPRGTAAGEELSLKHGPEGPALHGSAVERAYLQRLGERVREARARRGVSRRVLARDSGVSERYLAELESGRGNISILLLRQIGAALDLPMQALLLEEHETQEQLLRTMEYLRRLPAGKLERAREVLAREFGAPEPGARRQRVALIGLRGAGKSSLGAMLARERGVPFVELDRVIEETSGLALSAIFDLYGQSGFRRLERECLDLLLEQYSGFVLATGGSLVSEAATYEHLLSNCFTIWLRATPEEHMERVIAQGDTRPMSGNREAMQELRGILAGREALYRRADVSVDTSGKTPGEAFQELLRVSPRAGTNEEV